MTKKLYEESSIQEIANAIRSKNGSTDTYKVSEMATAIDNIETGGGGEEQSLPLEDLLYYNTTETTLLNSILDTELDILSVDSSFTIYVKFKGSAANSNTSGKQYDFLHCIRESSPWPGIGIDIYNGKYRFVALTKTQLTNISGTDTEERSFYIEHTAGSGSISISGDLGDYTLSGTWANVSNTLIFGANKSTTGTYSNYWNGTIYKVAIYQRLLSDSEKEIVEAHGELEKIDITEDGTYVVRNYDIANVSVLGNLSETKDINTNGTYNVKNYANVNINVTGGWEPEPDWWDIDSILENDTENYEGKIIALLIGGTDKTAFTSKRGWSKIKLSDGTEYTSTATHVWDTTKDKECSLGYKTRYVIYYYTNSTDFTYASYTTPYETMYIICNNIRIVTPSANPHSNHPFAGSYTTGKNIEAIKFKNCTFTGNNFPLYNMPRLKYIEGYEGVDNSNATYMYNSFTQFEKLPCVLVKPKKIDYCFASSSFRYIPYIDTSECINFYSSFNACKANVIESLDFSSATTINNIFNGCDELYEIKNISNIKITGISFYYSQKLNYATLIRILNALYDYSSEESTTTHTITLGTTNLAKLTDDEKAIATEKGWTLA